MKERINVAELLKDCPSGMELDCPIMENIYFDEVLTNSIKCYYIKNSTKTRNTVYFNHYGEFFSGDNSKCVIFPKGKTTWEGFHRPFKDGDVIANNTYVAIFHKLDKIPNGVYNDVVYYHCWCRKKGDGSKFKIDFGIGYESNFRFATDKEKQVLFNVIKTNGYKWNAETKTLKKLVKPRFKVGNRVKSIYNNNQYDIVGLTDTHYTLVEVENKFKYTEPIIEDKNLELVPDKFDINTLKPFDNCKYSLDNGRTWKFAQYWYIMDNYKIDDIQIELWQD